MFPDQNPSYFVDISICSPAELRSDDDFYFAVKPYKCKKTGFPVKQTPESGLGLEVQLKNHAKILVPMIAMVFAKAWAGASGDDRLASGVM